MNGALKARSLPSASQKYIDRLTTGLKRRQQLHLLDVLPPPSTLTFLEDIKALKILLGDRRDSDDVKTAVWAHILPERSDIDPPILFREIDTSIDGQPRTFSRPASSLLRKATDLQLPFCYLQFYPDEGVKDVRGMLCAIVLYYTLIAGLNDYALHWNRFDICFIEALSYINDRAQQFPFAQYLGVTSPPDDVQVRKGLQASVSARGIDEEHSAAERPLSAEKQGGLVRSVGSSVVVRPNTALARLAELLGPKVRLLDRIPKVPVKIVRQTAYPSYWPYCLRLGTYQPPGQATSVNLWVYYTQQKLLQMIIHAGGADEEYSWIFDTLQDIHAELFEPFKSVLQPASGSKSTQAIKLRYMTQYYFIVAAHQGLIDEPPIGVAPSTIALFCAACNAFEVPGSDSDDDTEMVNTEALETRSAAEDESDASGDPLSYLVKLRIDGEILAEIVEGEAERRGERAVPSIGVQPPSQQPNDMTLDDMDVAAVDHNENESGDAPEHVPSTPEKISRPHFREADGAEAALHSKHGSVLDDMDVAVDHNHNQSGDAQENFPSTPANTSRPHFREADGVEAALHSEAESVISIGSSIDSELEVVDARKLPPSNIIDLCSDDDDIDSVLGDMAAMDVDATPRAGPVACATQGRRAHISI